MRAGALPALSLLLLCLLASPASCLSLSFPHPFHSLRLSLGLSTPPWQWRQHHPADPGPGGPPESLAPSPHARFRPHGGFVANGSSSSSSSSNGDRSGNGVVLVRAGDGDGDGDNLQCFTGTLGAAAPAITASGDGERVYEVDGDTFPDFASAAQRACDDQFDTCQEAANANGNSGDLTVDACSEQQNACESAVSSASITTFGAVAVASSTAAPSATSTSTSSSSTTSTTSTTSPPSSEAESPTTTTTTPSPSPTSSPTSTSAEETTAAPTSSAVETTATALATTTVNLGPDPDFPEWDIICDE